MGLSLCRQLFHSSPFLPTNTSASSPPSSPSFPPTSLFTSLSTPPSMRLTTLLLQSPPVAPGDPRSSWSAVESSPHMLVRDEGATVWRQPSEQSSDAARSSGGVRAGLHLWEVSWLVEQRGSHALLGVCTNGSARQASGYTALVGGDSRSWGWELSTNQLWHDGKEVARYPTATEEHHHSHHHHHGTPMDIPERVVVALDADAGTLGYVVEGCYLGVAFSGLPKGEELFLSVSCVWGGASIQLRYLGGMSRKSASNLLYILYLEKWSDG